MKRLLALATILVALSGCRSSDGGIKFRTGEKLFCYKLETHSGGASCYGPSSPEYVPHGLIYTYPWDRIDHIEQRWTGPLG
jgi:hypothetical protein